MAIAAARIGPEALGMGPEANDDPIQPDTVVPCQFHAGGEERAQGERRLMAAILGDAIALCLRHPTPNPTARKTTEIAKARQWVASRSRAWPCSFERICEVLELDPEAVRARLAVLQAHANEGAPLRFHRSAVYVRRTRRMYRRGGASSAPEARDQAVLDPARE